MTIPKINSAHGSDTRNIINRAIDLINVQGKSIQDLVAEGQLTPSQYATLIQTVNGLISKGDVAFSDIDINKGKLLPKHLSEEVLKMLTGDAPVNAVPADGSITKRKMADKAIDRSKLSEDFMDSGRIENDVSIDTVMDDGNYIITAGNPGTFPAGESPDQNWCMSVVNTELWGKQTLYKLTDPDIIYYRTTFKKELIDYNREWKTRELSLYNRRIEPDESIDTVTKDGNYIVSAGNPGTFPEGESNTSFWALSVSNTESWGVQSLYWIGSPHIRYVRTFRTNGELYDWVYVGAFSSDKIKPKSLINSALEDNFLYRRRIPVEESIDNLYEDGTFIVTGNNIGTYPFDDYGSAMLEVMRINGRWTKQRISRLANTNDIFIRSLDSRDNTHTDWERVVTDSYLESRLPVFDGGGGGNSGYEGHLKVLMIGNSFSLDTTNYLHHISASAGVNMTVGVLYRSGEGLESHLNNATNDLNNYTYYKRVSENGYSNEDTTDNISIKTGILDEDWDIITFQQRSGHSSDYSTYQPFLNDLKDYVDGLKTNVNVKYGLLQTWGYANDEQMYHEVVDAYENAMFDADIGILIPVGTAIQNARNVPRIQAIDTDLTNDNYHLGVLGDYIAGLTMFKNLYPNTHFSDVNYKPEEVTNYQKYMAGISAENANLKPFKVTNYK